MDSNDKQQHGREMEDTMLHHWLMLWRSSSQKGGSGWLFSKLFALGDNLESICC